MHNFIFPFLWMRGEKEEILRGEISRISQCGIRGLCVEARPHEDFCGPLWWRDMDIVLDEAKKRNMKIYILDDKHFPTGYAAGLIETKYPERRKWYLADTTADLFGGARERTLNVSRMLKPVIGYWQIGEKVNEEERKNNQLIALIALRFTAADLFASEAVDLTDRVKDGTASFFLPEGQWRVHAIYKTRTDGGNETYINMLDAVSAHTQIEGVYEAHYRRYPEEFGKTIAGFFSDEPELGNIRLPRDDAKVGTKGIPLPWSDELEMLLRERWEENYRNHLAFLFARTQEDSLCAQLRYDYMDCVTRLYEKNFSSAIGNWCAEHGVEYIGHVVEDNGSHSRTGHGPGHWFRAMTGQDMAGIDVIGSQMIFGAPTQTRCGMGGMELDGEFFHYILGKLGASSGHLDPRKKGRTMCELFGAYGWNFGVRDMRYLLDQLLVRGVNHLVPHAFSMAEYPDPDCPPHFYAQGHNGQFAWFAELMKYAGRMCVRLNNGTHVSSAALLYDGEADWAGEHMPMQKAGRVLMQNQIEFDVVSADMLSALDRYNGSFDGKKLVLNDVSFDVLIVPFARYLPGRIAEFACKCSGFPVIFIDGFPDEILQENSAGKPENISDLRKHCRVVRLEELAGYLNGQGFRKIRIDPAFAFLSVYHYRKSGQIFLLMNESPDEAFEGSVHLPSSQPLYVYDGDTDVYVPIEAETLEHLVLEPGQCLMILEVSQLEEDQRELYDCGAQELCSSLSSRQWKPMRRIREQCRKEQDLSGNWMVELCRPQEYPRAFRELSMETLVPVSDIEPAFSGIIRYSTEIEPEEDVQNAVFEVQSVFEVMRLTVNGKDAGVRLTPPYRLEIGKYLHAGKNTLTVEVANTPGRDQQNYPSAPFDFQHEAMEPSGMFGKVTLYYN